jgi:hypothetical protein
MKYSTKNIAPISAALGLVYISVGVALIRVGTGSFLYGIGFRKGVTK